MATKHEMRTCPKCHANVVMEVHKANHTLHIIMSIITVGFWLPIYGLAAIDSALRPTPKCPVCTKKKDTWW